jgi:hypothetical protein
MRLVLYQIPQQRAISTQTSFQKLEPPNAMTPQAGLMNLQLPFQLSVA